MARGPRLKVLSYMRREGTVIGRTAFALGVPLYEEDETLHKLI